MQIMKKLNLNFQLLAVVIVILLSTVNTFGQPESTERAITFFGTISNAWETIIQPVARRQAVRHLKRVSNSLDDLANDKQDLLEFISASDLNANRGAIRGRIDEFQETTRRTRRNIQQFSSILPAPYRNTGNDVANDAFWGLGEKWQTLRNIQRLLDGSGSVDSARIQGELRTAIQQVLRVKGRVDELIAQIERS